MVKKYGPKAGERKYKKNYMNTVLGRAGKNKSLNSGGKKIRMVCSKWKSEPIDKTKRRYGTGVRMMDKNKKQRKAYMRRMRSRRRVIAG